MSRYDLGQIRSSMQVPWDAERERRVLDGALRALRRRARRKRTLEWGLAAAAALVLFRFVPSAYFVGETPAPSFDSSPPRASRAPVASPVTAVDGGTPTGTGGYAGASGFGSGGAVGSVGNGGKAGTS